MVAAYDFRWFPRKSFLKYCFKYFRELWTLNSFPDCCFSPGLVRFRCACFGQSKDMSLEDVIKSKGLVFELDWNQLKLNPWLFGMQLIFRNCQEISLSPPFFIRHVDYLCLLSWRTVKLTIQVATASVQLAAPRWSIRIWIWNEADMIRVDGCWWTKSREAVEVGSRSMFLLLSF